MILQNERQCDFARLQLIKLEIDLDKTQTSPPDLPAVAQNASERCGALLISDLRAQIAEYEKLCAGQVKTLALDEVLVQLRATLARTRIARGWTPRQLAEQLGTSEQQVQKDEAGAYAGASLKKLGRVAAVLGVSLSGRDELTCSDDKLRSARRAASNVTKPAVSSRWLPYRHAYQNQNRSRGRNSDCHALRDQRSSHTQAQTRTQERHDRRSQTRDDGQTARQTRQSRDG